MSSIFDHQQKLLIGVVHLRPLPGSPRWQGRLDNVIAAAVADAKAYERGGANALIIENFGDVPFTKSGVGPETVAAMAVAARSVREVTSLPIGFNVLRNDPRAGLALCAAVNGSFIRVNVHTGAMVTDQGLIEGHAHDTLRSRRSLDVSAEILADVHVKHAIPLGNMPIEIAARDALERGLADTLIISGTGTGVPTELRDVRAVRQACPKARILIGSGVTSGNVASLLPLVDGFIVGTSLKAGGKVENQVDPKRVATLARAISRGS